MPVPRDNESGLERFGFANDESIETVKEKKQKKKKRSRNEQVIEEVNQEVTVEKPTESTKKKQKKEKRQKTQVQQDQEVESIESTPADTDSTEKKKKKKKNRTPDANEMTIETQVDTPKEVVTEKKKDKKHENGSGTNSKGNGQFASTPKKGMSGRKDYYQESEKMSSYTDEDVNEFRTKNRIAVSYLNDGEETEVPSFSTSTPSFKDLKPILAFDELVLPDPKFLDVCKTFKKPTPIQSQCWPFVLSGLDVIGLAETGSGKTLAFGIPALVHIRDQKPVGKKGGPIVLVLSPTRELALQTADVFAEAGKSIGLRNACFYGGVNKDTQYAALQAGIHVLVSTPGRLIDLIQEGMCNLSSVSYLVLDEADRMLDIGFEKDIRTILEYIPKQRQTIMFSATWPKSIQDLAHSFLSNPVKVTAGSAELAANHNVKQIVEVLAGDYEKDRRLLDILKKYHKGQNRILIFVLYKKEAPRVERLLQNTGYKVIGIHGDKSQNARFSALNEFKSGETPLLVATDVAARGLDIPDVEYVINYSFPLTIEDYVHRIGRTGRAGKTGISHTFFTAFDKLRAAELVAVLQEANSDVPEELRKLGSYGTAKKAHKLYGNHYNDAGNKPMPKKTHMKFDD